MLVLPCTFSEPIGLELRAKTGDVYEHAQLFTGFMYVGAAICMWFLRAWKIGELERLRVKGEEREKEVRDNDSVLNRPGMARPNSVVSVRSTFAPRGFWSLQRV